MDVAGVRNRLEAPVPRNEVLEIVAGDSCPRRTRSRRRVEVTHSDRNGGVGACAAMAPLMGYIPHHRSIRFTKRSMKPGPMFEPSCMLTRLRWWRSVSASKRRHIAAGYSDLLFWSRVGRFDP